MIKVTIIDWEMCGHSGVQWINPHAVVDVRSYEFVDRPKEWYDAVPSSAKEHYAEEAAHLRQIHATITYAPSGQSWGTIRVAETPEQIAAMMAVACRPITPPIDANALRREILAIAEAGMRTLIGKAMDRHLTDVPHDGARES